MVLWIVLGTVALGVLIMGLTLRALFARRAPLVRQQAKLERNVAKAQELAQVAQGLQAHADSLRLRADLVAQQLEEIKKKARASRPGPA